MDAVQSDCDVASTTWQSWHQIPWSDVHRVVARLQTRIAKAAKAGEWRKVRSLQGLLTRSHLAGDRLEKYSSNAGSHWPSTPGVFRMRRSTDVGNCVGCGGGRTGRARTAISGLRATRGGICTTCSNDPAAVRTSSRTWCCYIRTVTRNFMQWSNRPCWSAPIGADFQAA